MSKLHEETLQRLDRSREVFDTITNPVSLHIIKTLEFKRNISSTELADGVYKTPVILKYLRRLMAIKLVRRDVLGKETTYILNHDRLDTITSIAASL